MIGHTQPRRIAARSVAARVAAEIGTGLGQLVGYQVRFRQRIAPGTLVKLMTDGILLAEIQRDRDLLAYDTLIIDEAHERTLNIDFVLGYLRQLVERRPDLRVVVASATLEADKLRAFFGEAPVIEVEGRTHPIEIRYRPGEEGDDTPEKVAGALEELRDEPGDVLVFLSGGARDPRDRDPGRTPPAAGHRAVPPPCPDVRGPPAGVVRSSPPAPRGACDERRGDLADGAGDPLRHRRGHRQGEPVRASHRSAAAAGGADRTGLGRPARRAVRADRTGGVHPALRRGGSRGPARPPRARDPPLGPRGGAAAHAVAGDARRGAFPVHRPSRPAPRQRRPAAAARARGGRCRRGPHQDRGPARTASARPEDRAHAARSARPRLRRRRARHRELPERARSSRTESRTEGGGAGRPLPVRGPPLRLSRDRQSLAPFPLGRERPGRVDAPVLPPSCPVSGPDAGLARRPWPDPRRLPRAGNPAARIRGLARTGPPGAALGSAALRRLAHAGGTVPRASRDRIPACPELGPPSGRRAVDRRRRGGGDRAGTCVRRRTGSRGMGGGGGRRSRAPHPLRRALGRAPRRADGVRAGGAVRAGRSSPGARCGSRR